MNVRMENSVAKIFIRIIASLYLTEMVSKFFASPYYYVLVIFLVIQWKRRPVTQGTRFYFYFKKYV